MRSAVFAVTCLASLILARPGWADSMTKEALVNKLVETVPDTIEDDWQDLPEFQLRTLAEFFHVLDSPEGVSREQIETLMRLEIADARARTIAEFLYADLDGDLQITRAEALAFAQFGMGFSRDLRYGFLVGDTNADGRISLDEIQARATTEAEDQMSSFQFQAFYTAIAFDLDGDGATTWREVIEARDLLNAGQ